jgi:hypothetical protein
MPFLLMAVLGWHVALNFLVQIVENHLPYMVTSL